MKKMLSLILGLSLAVTLMAAPALAQEAEKAPGENLEQEASPEEAQPEEAFAPESEGEGDASDPLLDVLAAVLVKREGLEDETSEEYLQKVADQKRELEGLSEEELTKVLEGLSEEEMDTVLAVLLEDLEDVTYDEEKEKDFWSAVGEALEGIDEKKLEEFLSQIDTEKVKAFLGDLGKELGDVTEEKVEDFLKSFSEEDYSNFWNGLFEAFGGAQA